MMQSISFIIITCLSLLFLCGQINPLPTSSSIRELERDLLVNATKIEFKPGACPSEFNDHIRTSPDRPIHRTGQNLTLDCIGRDVLALSSIENQDVQYRQHDILVYPAKTRSCLADGTWSSKPPVCTWIPTAKTPMIDFSISSYCDLFDCTSPESCGIKTLDAWKDVGTIDHSCSISRESFEIASKSIRRILYVFSRHLYLSFILIPPTKALMNVKVSVKNLDMIDGLSEESQRFLSNHYETFRMFNKSDGCAVTQLAVYTREILLEYHHYDEKEHEKLPDVEFFAIPEPGNSRRGAWNGLGCPKEPTIPHSTKKIDRHGGSRVNVTYTCNSGYSMKDPITREHSDGVLRCRNNFEWEPYPFPVCIKDPQTISDVRRDSETDGKTINTYGDDEMDREEPQTPNQQTIQRLDPQKHVHQQSDQSKNLNYDADILIEAMGQSEAQHDESFAKESGAKLDSPTTKDDNKWMILAFCALALSGVVIGILLHAKNYKKAKKSIKLRTFKKKGVIRLVFVYMFSSCERCMQTLYEC